MSEQAHYTGKQQRDLHSAIKLLLCLFTVNCSRFSASARSVSSVSVPADAPAVNALTRGAAHQAPGSMLSFQQNLIVSDHLWATSCCMSEMAGCEFQKGRKHGYPAT